MPRVPVNGIQIDYQEFGEGQAIVFCHGAGGNLLSWWQQIPHFSTGVPVHHFLPSWIRTLVRCP